MRPLLVFFATLCISAAQDARDIVLRSIAQADANAKLTRNYTFLQRVDRFLGPRAGNRGCAGDRQVRI
jgi:hypothetical protein